MKNFTKVALERNGVEIGALLGLGACEATLLEFINNYEDNDIAKVIQMAGVVGASVFAWFGVFNAIERHYDEILDEAEREDARKEYMEKHRAK